MTRSFSPTPITSLSFSGISIISSICEEFVYLKLQFLQGVLTDVTISVQTVVFFLFYRLLRIHKFLEIGDVTLLVSHLERHFSSFIKPSLHITGCLIRMWLLGQPVQTADQ